MGEDYEAIPGSVAFADGQTTATITVTPYDDGPGEGDETVDLTLNADASYTVGAPSSATVTIHEDLPPPTVTIDATDATANEEAGDPGEFTVTRTGDTSADLTVTYSVSGTATEGDDYTALSGSVVILAGQSTATISVEPIDDTLADPDETVIATLDPGADYTVGTSDSATVTITDSTGVGPGSGGSGGGDSDPVVSIQASDPNAAEAGPDPGEFTVSRTGDTANDLTVNYTVAGSATAGEDYEALPGSVVIAAGQTSATIAVNPADDSWAEGNETVEATLSPATEYSVGTATATVTIADDADTGPVVTIEAIDDDAFEVGPDGGEFSISRTGNTDQNLTVWYTVGGSATSDDDYNALSGSVIIFSGDSSAIVTVNALEDSLDEGSETVILTLSEAAGYDVGAPNSDTVTIYDGSSATDPTVDLQIYNGGENGPLVQQEDSLGAFTVANLNDTDGDGQADNNDGNGVSAEVDLMRLVLRQPQPYEGGEVSLTVPVDKVALWEESTKSTRIAVDPDTETVTFDLTAGDKTIWVEVVRASTGVRDITMTMSYRGETDSVKATGIWASATSFRNTQGTATAVSASGNQITLTTVTAFSPGNYVHVFDNGSWETYTIVGVDAGTTALTLNANLRTTINGGEIVRQGYPAEVDKQSMIDSFLQRASAYDGDLVDGAMLGTNSHFYNSMVMTFALGPAGIGDVIVNHPESGIVIDITRQKEERGWTYSSSTSGPTLIADGAFPTGDIPNDDSPNQGQRDEDTDPFVDQNGAVSENIFSRDMPGQATEEASAYRWVYRWNFREFVRIRFDGAQFANENWTLEGSRASGKQDWNSRMDLVRDAATGNWDRNPNSGAQDNQIRIGHVDLGTAP